jgi:hypothetical protein
MRFDYITSDTEKFLAPFFSPRILSITFNCIWILGLLLMLLWPQKDLFNFIEEQKIPLNFLGIFGATLLINSYVNLRFGRGEMSPDDFFIGTARKEVVTFEEEHDFLANGLVEFLLHTLLLLLLLLPILVFSATISSVTPQIFVKAFSILFTSSVLCRMFGFLMYLLCGKRNLVGYLLARIFFISFVFATGFFAAFVNPILLIRSLHRGEEILGRFSMSAYSLHMIIVTSAILFLTLANQAMVRRAMHKERLT